MNYGNSQPQSENIASSNGLTSAQGFELVRKFGSSLLFLSAIIAYALMILLQIINLFMPRWDYISNFLRTVFNDIGINEFGEFSGYFYNFDDFADSLKIFYNAGVVIGVIALIGPILIGLGLWMQYSASKNNANAQIKTTGLSIIKVITVINLVLFIATMAFMAIVMLIAGVAASSAAGNEAVEAVVVLLIVFGIFFLIFAAVTAFMIVYYVKILSIIKSLKITASTGKINNKIPVFVPIVNIIMAANQLFSVLYLIFILPVLSYIFESIPSEFNSYGDFSKSFQIFNILPVQEMFISGIISLLNGVFLVLISVLILSYRKKITSILYYNNNHPQNLNQNYIQNPANPPSLNPPNIEIEQTQQKEERRQEPFVPPQ